MTTTLKATAVAAALALSVAGPVSADNAGETMLLSAVMNEVSGLGLDTVDARQPEHQRSRIGCHDR